jgi:hypothetical protein
MCEDIDFLSLCYTISSHLVLTWTSSPFRLLLLAKLTFWIGLMKFNDILDRELSDTACQILIATNLWYNDILFLSPAMYPFSVNSSRSYFCSLPTFLFVIRERKFTVALSLRQYCMSITSFYFYPSISQTFDLQNSITKFGLRKARELHWYDRMCLFTFGKNR